MTISSHPGYQELYRAAEAAAAARADNAKIRIQIGSATCENAAGAAELFDEFNKFIQSSGREDIVLHRTGCTGRCSCEPIVGVMMPGPGVLPVKYQRVDRHKAHEIFTSHILGGTPLEQYVLDPTPAGASDQQFFFCDARRCGKGQGHSFGDIFESKLRSAGIEEKRAQVIRSNCFGVCSCSATQVLVRPGNILYRIEREEDLDELIEKHVLNNEPVERLKVAARPVNEGFFSLYGDVAFFNRQTRIALRNSGVIDPESIDEYILYRGFAALADILATGDRRWVIDEITKSKLRGRGGGGYPTGLKWADAAGVDAPVKYIICNADEGDPGAFMDRSMLEGDPFSILEGMIIGGFAVGAQRGFLYIRAEYPLAVKRIQGAIEQARERGLLGANILGSDFCFDLEIRLGAGAFVCGEETALINSIEGQRGQPRLRPPFPTRSGLWGKPTVINNVETFALIPAILRYGAHWFSSVGTEKSGGTKVFALAGKVKHTGLVEVPMGTSLREIVFNIGGGIAGQHEFKAVQTGGPAGGCIHSSFLDTPVDFDTLAQAGSIMGSGGMIVMDDSDCMVDIAKYFLTFSANESCGKCTPCREGTKRMLEIMERITSGRGVENDLVLLERLALLVKKSSLCGLGRAAPNPVLSTLKYFRDEYEAHVSGAERRCPAKKCVALLHYEITDKCVGCTVCARNCPVNCISGDRRAKHVIDQERCVRCGKCVEVCRFEAVHRA